MCPPFRKLIPAYLKGELPLRASRRVELHLDLCTTCRAAAGLKAAPSEHRPSSVDDGEFSRLRARMAAQLEAQQASKPWPRRWWWPAR